MNFAIIGFGYWGPNYARILNETKSCRLKWVVDKHPKSFFGFKKRYPTTTFTSNINQVISDPETKAYIICTPATTHYKLIKKIVKMNKHVLVEKPLTSSAHQAKKVIDLTRNKNSIFMTGHTFIYNPAISYIKKYIDQRKLGKVFYFYAIRSNLGPIRRDVNCFWDLASHDLSTFLYLFGNNYKLINSSSGTYLNPNRADVGFTSIRFSKKILGHLHVSWLDPIKIRKLVVVGSKKMIVFDDTSPEEKIKIYDKKVRLNKRTSDFDDFQSHSLITGDILVPSIPRQEPLANQVKEFLKSIRTGKQPLTDLKHGYKVVKLLESISKRR